MQPIILFHPLKCSLFTIFFSFFGIKKSHLHSMDQCTLHTISFMGFQCGMDDKFIHEIGVARRGHSISYGHEQQHEQQQQQQQQMKKLHCASVVSSSFALC